MFKIFDWEDNYISLNNKKESQNTPDNMIYNSIFTKDFRLNLKSYKFFRRELNINSLDVKDNFFFYSLSKIEGMISVHKDNLR